MLVKFNGVSELLNDWCSLGLDSKQFAEDLLNMFPKSDAIAFASCLPGNDSDEFNLHLSDLSWFPSASTKPPPYLHTCLALWDEITTNGFVTKGLKLNIMHPVLYDSLRFICCRRGSMSNDLMRVAFTNAKLSARGSIRRSHDVATWLSKMSMLCERGLKADSAIKSWNSEATRESQLVGQKRVALLALLNAPNGTKELLLQHASFFGSSSAYSEECFSAKNLFPGSQPRSVLDKAWRARLTVTDPGFLLFSQYTDACHHQKVPEVRGKLSKERILELSQLAQLVTSMEQELKDGGVVTTKISEALLACDGNLELELQVALSEKSSKWKIADVTLVQEVLKNHSAAADSKFYVEKRMVAAGELEREEYDLMKKMFEHDLKSFENWKVRCADRDAAIYHAELQHKVHRQAEAQKQASSLLDPASSNWMASLEVLGNAQDTLHRIKATVGKIKQIFQIPAEEIYVVAVCNWSSPSLVSSAAQKCQATVLGALCNDAVGCGRTIGLVLEPCHTYSKGQLWKQEELLRKQLAEWAKQHHVEKLFESFLSEEYKPLTPLPGPPDQLAQPGPQHPTLSLLAWGTGKAKDTLKTPDKVLKAWWDGNFASEFRALVEEARQNHQLDIKIDESQNAQTQKRRRVNAEGESVPGQNNSSSSSTPAAATTTDVKVVDVPDIPTLCFECKVTSNPSLVLKVTIGQGVFLENLMDTPQVLKAGVVLCGYYKGKFWSPDGNGEKPCEKSDVLFRLESSMDHVMLNSKYLKVSEVIREKRKLTPADAHVAYHELQDSPTPTDASAFNLVPKKMDVFFKISDFPAVKQEEDGQDKLMIPSAHLAGTVPSKVWQTSDLAKVTWAVKWPAVASKGLQPVRPMIVCAKDITVPPKQAVEVVKPST
ncbi:Uncharacterized protein SCF082_LOCUS14370 [Durusdinium trenchii]|uniref:Uncharacterized protein n=1 Tax=Durusdinium trenchii TaxID=1381693 RepID=A0ABP0JYA7_9DINO